MMQSGSTGQVGISQGAIAAFIAVVLVVLIGSGGLVLSLVRDVQLNGQLHARAVTLTKIHKELALANTKLSQSQHQYDSASDASISCRQAATDWRLAFNELIQQSNVVQDGGVADLTQAEWLVQQARDTGCPAGI